MASAQPVVPANSVVNNASFATGTTPLAPGTIAAIFGSKLDDGSKNPFSSFGANGELLTALGGASVAFNGISAPIFSAFPGQLNVQIPLELAGMTSAQVVVTVAGQSSAAQTVPIGPQSPGIFTTTQTGKGQGAVQIANSTIYAAPAGSISGSQSRAVKPGEFITIYCTGMGAVNNPPQTGKPAAGNPLSTTTATPVVTIGGVSATVSFSGLAPGFVGLYQVDVEIPQSAPGGGAVSLKLNVNGVDSNEVSIAIAAPPGPHGKKIGGGQEHSCAVTIAGGVVCWGFNQYGELGNGTMTSSSTPVPVSGLSSGVAAVADGGYFSCALTKTGNVWCWGNNSSNQLGTGNNSGAAAFFETPQEVLDPTGKTPMSGIVAITLGSSHACALNSAGGVFCWGDNTDGQLGDGPSFPKLPVPVQGLASGIAQVSAGDFYVLAVTTGGKVMYWGGGPFGTTILQFSNVPIPVMDSTGKSPLTGITIVSTGSNVACALTNSGTVLCWGDNTYGEVGNNSPLPAMFPSPVVGSDGTTPISGVTDIVSGDRSTCALTNAGNLLCWGYNFFGELTTINPPNSSTAFAALGISNVTQLTAGYDHNCAIVSSGNVECWGSNSDGEIGNGTTGNFSPPAMVLGVGGTGLLKLF